MKIRTPNEGFPMYRRTAVAMLGLARCTALALASWEGFSGTPAAATAAMPLTVDSAQVFDILGKRGTAAGSVASVSFVLVAVDAARK